LISKRVTFFAGDPLGEVPFCQYAIIRQPYKEDEISTFFSPMKTGEPAAILFRLAAAGAISRKITQKVIKRYFHCMNVISKPL
jgi:hypothetical protein